MNLTGHRFGSLSVTRPAAKSNRSCVKCDCGTKARSSFTAMNTKLLRGEIKHCSTKLHERRDKQEPRCKYET